MKFNGTIRFLIIISICVVYIGLRFWHLTDSCLWFDEIFSIHAAEMNWRDLIWFVAQDLIHPPLFYILLKIWIAVGGTSLLWLRFFPVFFSILAVVPFVLLCRQLKFSFPVIALALTFFAVNGSLIKYAQEVRMYSLLQFLALVSLWLFVRYLNTGKGFLIFIFVNICLVYSHYFGWLILASEILAVVILARERLKQIFIMFAAALLCFAPWIYAVWQAMKINANVGQNIGWMTKPNFSTIFQFVFDLLQPIYYEQSNVRQNIFDLLLTVVIVLLIFAAVAVAGGFYFARWKNESASEKRNFFLILIFFLTPLALAFTASWILPYSVWGTRHLIIAFAPFVILLANAFSKINFRELKFASIGLICIIFTAAFVFQTTRETPKYIWCAWENLANNLYASTLHGEDAANIKIYVFEDLVAYHFWFALRDSDRGFQIVKINGIEGLKEDAAYFLPRGFNKVQTSTQFEGERFFIAYRAKNWNESAPPLQNLKSQNYKIGEPQIFEAQGVKAFLVEVRRENQTTK